MADFEVRFLDAVDFSPGQGISDLQSREILRVLHKLPQGISDFQSRRVYSIERARESSKGPSFRWDIHGLFSPAEEDLSVRVSRKHFQLSPVHPSTDVELRNQSVIVLIVLVSFRRSGLL